MPERVAAYVAALYVETGGAYFGLNGVDPWDAEAAYPPGKETL